MCLVVSGRSPSFRRAGTLSPLPTCTEDLPDLPLQYSHGYHDSARLFLIFDYDYSRFGVPLSDFRSTTCAYVLLT